MRYRIKQFIRGIFARITSEDRAFIQIYLSQEEALLFQSLRVGEQRHSLNIAYNCLEESPNNPVLIKAALLHDVGKINSNLTLIHKSLVVLVLKLPIPEGILPGFIQKSLYYKRQHPNLGAEILENIGTEASVVFLTRHHHRDLRTPYTFWETTGYNHEGKSKENLEHLLENLALLQKYDEKN